MRKTLFLMFLSLFSLNSYSETIYETGDPFNGPFGIYGFDLSSRQSVAIRFTPKYSAKLQDVKVWLMSNDTGGMQKNHIQIFLKNSKGSVPGDKVLESWVVEETAVGWNPELIKIQSLVEPVLSQGQEYWIVLESDAAEMSPVWCISGLGTAFVATKFEGNWQEGGDGASVSIVISGETI